VVSADNGENFIEVKMPFKDPGQTAEKAAISNVDSFTLSFNDGCVRHFVYDPKSASGNGMNVEFGIVTKCPGPLTALAISPNGKVVICCGQ
jgi:hypothetical protein